MIHHFMIRNKPQASKLGASGVFGLSSTTFLLQSKITSAGLALSSKYTIVSNTCVARESKKGQTT